MSLNVFLISLVARKAPNAHVAVYSTESKAQREDYESRRTLAIICF